MNKWLEILAGLILIVVAIFLWAYTQNLGFWNFGTAAWEFLKGGIVWFIIMIGLLFLMLGISDLKN
ncbi:MAG: hypothetical protein WC533_04845 [Candidatus Pacearchaeota archaeon]